MSEEPGRPKYRADIDGLRGIAVLAVVAFHAFPGLAKAGFIGVDVFFVISGFLITTIILRGFGEGSFRFAEFYSRRIRRILPALIVTLLAVCAIGWFVLATEEYKQTGLHVAGGATFSSNFLLWRESGYFDTASERKVLLHLWSLAIEEQFYLLFPLALWAAHKKRLRPLGVIVAIGLISFIWNVHAAASDRTMDFYAPQTRIWELMIGAALAAVSLRATAKPSHARYGDAASIAGAIMLCLGAVFITKANPFPGWWALLPTLGAALLILGGAQAWINRRILSNRALVLFGLISFPLYLWHWPLLSFAYTQAGGTPSRALKLAIVVASIVLAWLTYRFVERPIRHGRHPGMVKVLLSALIAVGAFGFAAYRSGGLPSRAVSRKLDPYLATAKATVGYGGCVPLASDEETCKLGDQSAEPSAFVYGDSHAYSMRPVLARYAYETGRSFLYTSVSGCFLGERGVSGGDSAPDDCQARSEQVFAYVRDNRIPNVFLVVRWTNYDDTLHDGLKRVIEAYRAIGVHVYIFADNPLQKYQPEDALRKSEGTDASINAFSVTAAENAQAQGWMTVRLSELAGDSATVLDFTDAYCPDDICPLVQDGKFLYLDRDHLSTHGSQLIYPALRKALEKM